MIEIKKRDDLQYLLPSGAHVCEVGIAEARFSEQMLMWGNPPLIARLFLVDVWATHPELPGDGSYPQRWHNSNMQQMRERLDRFAHRVIPLRGLSHLMCKRVADGSLDMVFLDACHQLDFVRRDLDCWTPKVKPGGIISGHDFLNNSYGVKQAVEEFAAARGYTVHLIPEEKEEDSGFWFRKH